MDDKTELLHRCKTIGLEDDFTKFGASLFTVINYLQRVLVNRHVYCGFFQGNHGFA